MKVQILRFIEQEGNKALAKISGASKEKKVVNLYCNGEQVSSKETFKNAILFDIKEIGRYQVSVIFNGETFFSDAMDFTKITYKKKLSSQSNAVKTKHMKQTEKISGVENYFLDLKVCKGTEKIIQDFLYEKLHKSIELIRLNISFENIDDEDEIHQYEYYQFHRITDFDELCQLRELINSLECVAYCTVAPDTTLLPPPPLPLLPASEYELVESTFSDNTRTPYFVPMQQYFNHPHGMNIFPTWEKGIDGSAVTVRHLDFGIYPDHENFRNSNITVVNSREGDCHHGTASTGCIVAAKENFGVIGIAYGCQYYFYDTGDLDKIVEDIEPGDMVSIDLQFTVQGLLLPPTYSEKWWNSINLLTKNGAIVIMSAGNGGNDLQNTPVMPNYGDHGGILVGACSAVDGRRLVFSNYNDPTSLINSWGELVVTTGYGHMFKGDETNNRIYTASYNGTSSACPLSTGALALLQDYAIKKHQAVFSSQVMRMLITLSNYTEGVVGGIGYRPNVGYLLTVIDQMFGGQGPIRQWALNEMYDKGEKVCHNDQLWLCVIGHLAASDALAPGAGTQESDWIWQLIA